MHDREESLSQSYLYEQKQAQPRRQVISGPGSFDEACQAIPETLGRTPLLIGGQTSQVGEHEGQEDELVNEDADDEEYEDLVIVLPHAIAHHRAVMVELLHTPTMPPTFDLPL